ncbi:MAG: HlyD family efflux transporter periplasmic adaptor subunit [Prevotella sp.]|nr:HlyD family efflux transporter periplasmic adaptor subunit [Prevotella sp.]
MKIRNHKDSERILLTDDQLEKVTGGTRELARVSHPSLLFVLVAMLALCAVAAYWCAFGTINYKVTAQGVVFPFDNPQGIAAPTAGTIEHIMTSRGASVKGGDVLMQIRTEDSTTTIKAPTAGTVLTYRAEEEEVEENDKIVWLIPEETNQMQREMLVYVGFDDLRALKEGQQVQVTPADLQREDCGYAYGNIQHIAPYPTDRNEVASRLKLAPLASFIGDGAVYEIKVLLCADKTDSTKLMWSRQKSSSLKMGTGTLCNVQVITEKKRVWEVLVGRVSDTVDGIAGD